MKLWLLIPLLLCLHHFAIAEESPLFSQASINAREIIYPRPSRGEDLEKWYPLILLKSALDHSKLRYWLRPTSSVMVQSRAIKELTHGDVITVTWTMTDKTREDELLPVRIPIYKGLYGWRLLLTTQKKAEIYQTYNNVERFKKLIYLQGHDWPDSEILQDNDFNVTTAVSYEALFQMLLKGRGDVFPRSIIEVDWELSHRDDRNEFAVINHTALYYPTAMYFFFNKQDHTLAKAVEKGLMAMHHNGEFERLFNRFFAKAIARADLNNKQIIELTNQQLPKLTPLDTTLFWFRPDQTLQQTSNPL